MSSSAQNASRSEEVQARLARIHANNKPENFVKLANLITPKPPDWLSACLQSWAPTVMMAWAVEERQPTRAEMRRILAEIRDAAGLLDRALREAPVCEFLSVESLPPLDSQALRAVVLDIRRRAMLGRASNALADSTGKTKAGRGPAMPNEALSAKDFCALVVAELIRHFSNEYPVPRNQKAAEAAEFLWTIVGGKANSWGTNRLTSWRPHFSRAVDPKIAALPESTTLLKELRRHLSIYEERERVDRQG